MCHAKIRYAFETCGLDQHHLYAKPQCSERVLTDVALEVPDVSHHSRTTQWSAICLCPFVESFSCPFVVELRIWIALRDSTVNRSCPNASQSVCSLRKAVQRTTLLVLFACLQLGVVLMGSFSVVSQRDPSFGQSSVIVCCGYCEDATSANRTTLRGKESCRVSRVPSASMFVDQRFSTAIVGYRVLFFGYPMVDTPKYSKISKTNNNMKRQE